MSSMTQLWRLVLVCGCLMIAAGANALDAHSYANIDDVRATHASLNLRADFQRQQLIGTVDLTFDRLSKDVREVVLDTRDLTVRKVELIGRRNRALIFEMGLRDAILGSPLKIQLPAVPGATFKLRVQYETSPEASGLQWLTPAQTAGKQQPFVYSQSQAVHARSWIPLQDTPQVRLKYDAHIETPRNLLAVMSASNDPNTPRDGSYDFEMPQPIPSYLFALAIGDLQFKAIGARTGVYSEPSVLAVASHEFADVEAMLSTCEKLFGPYQWGRYDLLILPPSFMWGGMENPRLSFITPTVIAGDRSLVSLIAHELAHSWSGNLVTNNSWNSAWLNEGFTTYLERRIVEVVYGVDRRAMEDTLGMQSLRVDMAELEGKGDRDLTKLRVNLNGRDPDEGFSDVAYEKGRFFVGFLESRLGRDRLDAFMRDYFAHFAFQSVSTEQFLDYFEAQVLSKLGDAKLTQEEILAWIDSPGLPPTVVEPKSDAFAKVDEAKESWLRGELNAKQLPTGQWTAQQWLHFLDNLPRDIPARRLGELDAAFQLTTATNNMIVHSWLLDAIRAGYEPAYARLDQYLTSIGRRKLVKDLYEELAKSPEGKDRAKGIYAKARPLYQVPLADQLDKLLN
ncbi:MAG TPA: M1 family metallopeptidase [Steroidobacteraceae bacterium]|nr:M1 family metallopeptidase [Steroidobacteraceae bacterium]